MLVILKKRKNKFFILFFLLTSCVVRVNRTAFYYKDNKAMVLRLQENYIKLMRIFPDGQFEPRGTAGDDKEVSFYYRSGEQSKSSRCTRDGKYVEGNKDYIAISLADSVAFNTFVSDFAKSRFLSASFHPGWGDDAVFFALGTAVHNSRDYLGILITSKPLPDKPIRKLDENTYIYEMTVQ
ncbi:MAG: hypothetical protein ACJ77K_12500 [Bacteroidia bacterium]|jgi:hypothetical protein